MPSVQLPGSTVHYTAAGTGPGLVLVHGTDGTGEETYGHLVDRFTDRHTVVLPEFAGSGRTTDPGGPLTLELLVAQVAAATRDAVSTPVDLVGFSLGAQVAAALAADHPDLVQRLVLVAGWPGNDDARLRLGFDVWSRLEKLDRDLYVRFSILSVFSARYLSTLGDDGIAELLSGESHPGLRRQIDLDLRVDLRDRLPRIAAPTLVIGCCRDQLIPVEQQRRLHAAIPGSRYTEIDSGHVVMQEHPDEFVAAVRGFLRDSPGS